MKPSTQAWLTHFAGVPVQDAEGERIEQRRYYRPDLDETTMRPEQVGWADAVPDGPWAHPQVICGVLAKACLPLEHDASGKAERWVRVVLHKVEAADGVFRPSLRVDVVDRAGTVMRAGLALPLDGSEGIGLVAVAVRELLKAQPR